MSETLTYYIGGIITASGMVLMTCISIFLLFKLYRHSKQLPTTAWAIVMLMLIASIAAFIGAEISDSAFDRLSKSVRMYFT